MTPRITSAYVTVLDMRRAVAFYESLFQTTVSDLQDRMSSFVWDTFTLLLYDPKQDGVEPMFGDNVVLNIEVEDVAATFAALEQAGCKVVVPITTVDPDVFFQVQDTEGNTLEFYQVIDDRA